MTTDIVERLRQLGLPGEHELGLEAAAEIERLRMLIAKYEALAAAAKGTLEAPQPSAPFTVIDAPPSTPR